MVKARSMKIYRNIAVCLITVWTIMLPAVATAVAPPVLRLAALSTDQPAPGFDLTLLNGEKVTLREFQGKSVLIVFWRSG